MTSVLGVVHHPKQAQVLAWKFKTTENVSSFVSFAGNTLEDILPMLEEQCDCSRCTIEAAKTI